jgi:hypothetical protein
MLGPGGFVQHQFGQRRHTAGRIEQNPPNRFGNGRAPRFSGVHNRPTHFSQSVGQQTGLGAFSGPIPAFKSDKQSRFHDGDLTISPPIGQKFFFNPKKVRLTIQIPNYS